MPKIDGTSEAIIVKVSSRKVKNDTMTLFECETTDGTKWVTFKRPLAEKAHSFVGKTAEIDYTIETTDAGHTNYYLNNIRSGVPAGEQAFAAPVIPEQPGKGPDVTFKEFAGMEDKKQQSIHRQVSAKVAALISKSPEEFWANVKDLYIYFEKSIVPNSGVTSHSSPAATLDDSFDMTPPHTNDDIPF